MDNYLDLYKKCLLCPRKCGIDRSKVFGFCRESDRLSIDSALLHFGEEPPISYKNGSGTIFFNGCSLRCPYCQNMEISQDIIKRKYYTVGEFVDIIEMLVKKNAENINFVTPDHFLPHIIEAVKIIKKKGYKIPFVYNCSGYETIEHLEMTLPYIDIYLYDYKYANSEVSLYCNNINDYPEVCLNGLKFLMKNKGDLVVENGKGLSGVMVRHLVIPDFVENSIEVINNLFFEFGNTIYLSLMSQWTPKFLKKGYDRINRRLYREEYEKVVDLVLDLGFKNVFIQEYIEGEDRYIPDFKNKNMFDNW